MKQEMTGWQWHQLDDMQNICISLQTDNHASTSSLKIIMVALWNRADHYIFALWFLLAIFFFSSPNLSGRRLDVCHTSTHDVALVRI